jgi:predicted Zn-dependent protease
LEAAVAGNAAGQRLARLLAAEIALAQGNPAVALQLADGVARRPELLLVSQAQVRTGRGAEVAQRLQTWVANHPRDAAAWQLLSAAYAADGQPLRAVRAEAEARVAQLDYAAALDRLKAAQELGRRSPGTDHIEASIIDTRARAVDSLLREQALER